MELLNVAGISKRQGENLIVNNVSFTQQRFQKIAIAGETGSGKSTLLKIIAGLIQRDEGEVMVENKRVRGPEEKLMPGHPGVAYLSQQFELLNNYRVEELLNYANKLSESDAATLYKICQIDHLLKRRTDQLSGGERQRIAIAKLLISSPKLLLLDEPYSNLDIIHKKILKTVIRNIGKTLNISFILISHDPLDTLSWADEIIVLKDGAILQKGSPKEIYNKPVDDYIAGLYGSYNLINPGENDFFKSIGKDAKEKKLFIRPEKFKIVTNDRHAQKGKVIEVRFLGSSYEIDVILSEQPITVKTGETSLQKGDTIFISISREDVWYI